MSDDAPLPKQIGPYGILQRIGKGGMGEVFLAFDPCFERNVALKRIRTDLKSSKALKTRFLHEAKITGQLSHPSIIPVYTIDAEEDSIYYTMPYVEGETLRQILRRTRQLEKDPHKKEDSIGGSLPALARIFLQTCEAIAFAHTQQILHRDLKPENIIVGTYGQVLILDWGLAKAIQDCTREEFNENLQPPSTPSHFTKLGKAIGTLSYMAPERALGQEANLLTDIYSLGVILYQCLTLHFPFKRGSIQEFRQIAHQEHYIEASEVAPYRNIPKLLSHIAKKCLRNNPLERYQSVDEIIHDLKNYIEGRFEWFPAAQLCIDKKEDWEFQENVLLTEHVGVTGSTDIAEWVSMMVSKESFTGNTKIEIHARMGEESEGLGLLLSVPETLEDSFPNTGYCLWLGSDKHPQTKLFRSGVEVLHLKGVYLQSGRWHKVCIEKVDNNIYFSIDHSQKHSFISYLPLIGSRIGLMYRDENFSLKDFQVHVGSQQIKVSCLSIPDAFLTTKNFDQALSEYRRIGFSFPGRDEGREALFRAGITLIEKAKHATSPHLKEEAFQDAWDEFHKLHTTPAAPLEYLGKSLVHKARNDTEEEVKCLELACRKFPSHPLLPIIQDQIAYRMHSCSQKQRIGSYRFLLLVAMHLPHLVEQNDTQKLFSSLQKHWEPLPFLEPLPSNEIFANTHHLHFSMQLAFWLAKPYTLEEIIHHFSQPSQFSPTAIGNALFCLLEIGSLELVQRIAYKLQNNDPTVLQEKIQPLKICLQFHKKKPEEIVDNFFSSKQLLSTSDTRALLYLMRALIHEKSDSLINQIHRYLHQRQAPDSALSVADCCLIWSFLLNKKWDQAKQLFQKYPLELLNQENTLLHFLHLCFLQVHESKELTSVLYSGILATPFPRSYSLATHYLFAKSSGQKDWTARTFSWEKKQLYQQLSLYYHCLNDLEKKQHFKELAKLELVNVP